MTAKTRMDKVTANQNLEERIDFAEEAHKAELREARKGDLEIALAASGPGFIANMQLYACLIHEFMELQGFWESENTGEKIALMHSELSEALEADRKDAVSNKIPEFSGLAEEMADTVIRIMDFCAHHEIDLPSAMSEKMAYNLTRPYKHGKKY